MYPEQLDTAEACLKSLQCLSENWQVGLEILKVWAGIGILGSAGAISAWFALSLDEISRK